MESIVSRLKGGRSTEAMDGSDEDLMKLISRLRGGSSELETIAIVGKAGTGKTDLARNVYNHPLIVEHFDIRAWCTLSDGSRMQGIMAELLRSMKAEVSAFDSREQLIDRVCRKLYGKRYLIVVNGVSSSDDWYKLTTIFPGKRYGSRLIITTTELDDVSSIPTTHVHEMSLLDEDRTWDLLREEIFKGDPCLPQLESIGKMIATSCRGHRLVIEVVAGMLAAADQTVSAWEDIAENIKNIDSDSEVDEMLSLSYTYLPHHLRPCFLYLGIFPEDHEIHVSKLVKLWVAEGFLNESKHRSNEEIGEERVEDLVRRSLVWVSKRKSNGRIKSIAVHDLMRDVCLTQARIDHFVLQVGEFERHLTATDLPGYRRVSITYRNRILRYVYYPVIRTYMMYLYESERFSLTLSMENVALLRVPDLSNASLHDLAEEVFELFHLRFLAFRCGSSILEGISNLENLQTLIISPWRDGGRMLGLEDATVKACHCVSF